MNSTAAALIDARRRGVAYTDFPGGTPADLAAAYAIQDEILRIAPEPLAGWKIALVRPELRARHGTDRIVGPVLSSRFHRAADGATVPVTVYDGGFAAIEAEFAIVIGRDLPAAQAPFSASAIEAAVQSMHLGVEIAGSPLATISALGPTAVVADHGNNGGGILGPEITGWRDALAQIRTRTTINGDDAGEGSADAVPGGPLAALAFLADNLAARGIDLKAGAVVLTGMTTGMHPIRPGDRATIAFSGVGAVHVEIAAAPVA